MLTEPTDLTGGYKIRPLLIGCGAYPAITWLVKPFSNHLIYPKDKKFDRFLSSASAAVERAFGILKARWRYVLNCFDHNNENVLGIIIGMLCIAQHLPDEKRFLYRQW